MKAKTNASLIFTFKTAEIKMIFKAVAKQYTILYIHVYGNIQSRQIFQCVILKIRNNC